MLRISVRKIHAVSALNKSRAAVLNNQFSTVPDYRQYLEEHQVTVKGTTTDDYPPFLSFEDTPYVDKIKKVLSRETYTSPSPIQAVSWPMALDNKDLISVAKTGSGKTLGFLLPGFQKILKKAQAASDESAGSPYARRRQFKSPQVLVLAPTRELGLQIAEQAYKYESAGISTVACYGGAAKNVQVKALRSGADVVVATPGRCNDLLNDGAFDPSNVKLLVLDEADRMLDMGFEPQIREIIDQLPQAEHGRQTLMFTATWPKDVQQLAREFLTNPVQVNIGDQDTLNANKDIKQNIMNVKSFMKTDALLDLLEQKINLTENPRALPKTIIFAGTKATCDDLEQELRRAGYSAGALHGDKSQALRDGVMNSFRNGRVNVLIATDIAARGLDVPDIANVINYDFPNNTEDYVHRIGRTARAGAKGTSYTFLANKDLDNRRNMSDLVGVLRRCEQEIPEVLEGFEKGGNRFSDIRTTSFGGRGGRSSGGKFGGGGGFGGGERYGGGGGGFGGAPRGGDRYGGGGGSYGGGAPRSGGDRFGGGGFGGGGDRFGGGGGDRFGGGGERFGGGGFGGGAPRGGDRFGGNDRFNGSNDFGGDRRPQRSFSAPGSSSSGGFGGPRSGGFDEDFAVAQTSARAFSKPPATKPSFGFDADEFAELEELRRSHSARKSGP